MKGFLAITCAMLLAVAATASATTVGTKPVSAGIRGVAEPAASNFVDTNGQCNVTPWVDVCAVGPCSCDEVTGLKVTGNSGDGPLVASDFFVTVDEGINPATEPTVNGGPDPKCTPMYGVVTLTSTKNGQTQTLNLIGTTCKHVVAISANNPGGKHDKDVVSGGWGISSTPAPPSPHDESGWGTFTGTVVQSTDVVSLKLSGMVSK